MVQIGCKLEKWQLRHNFPKWSHRQIFWHCFVSLVKLSCLSKFHVNIITGSRVMTISFYKGLTRNPEIGNTPVWVSPIIWRLGRVRNTKLGTNVSNKMLLNTAKCQGNGFYCFWAIKGKPTKGAVRDWGRGGQITLLYIYIIRLKLQGKFFNLRIQYIVEFFSNLMLSKSESSLVTAYRLVLELSICIMLSHLRE